MTIFEIDARMAELLENAVDPETGELQVDDAELDSLQMERDSKVTNLALWVKELDAKIAAIDEEEKRLGKRKTVFKNQRGRVAEYIAKVLNGDKFENEKCAIKFTHGERCVIEKESESQLKQWIQAQNREDLFSRKIEIKTAAVKAALKAGEHIPFARLEKSENINIK